MPIIEFTSIYTTDKNEMPRKICLLPQPSLRCNIVPQIIIFSNVSTFSQYHFYPLYFLYYFFSFYISISKFSIVVLLFVFKSAITSIVELSQQNFFPLLDVCQSFITKTSTSTNNLHRVIQIISTICILHSMDGQLHALGILELLISIYLFIFLENIKHSNALSAHL